MLAQLCRLLDENRVDAQFYGPIDWHLQYCRGGLLKDLSLAETDTLIVHFAKLDKRPDVKRVVLSCHETQLFDIKSIESPFWDVAQFVSEEQAEFHGRPDPHVVIPNYVPPLSDQLRRPMVGTVGIIGNIMPRKQVHESIKRALADGHTELRLYGYITDDHYYKEHVAHLVDGIRVRLMGYVADKSDMYRELSAVYCSSIDESFDLVRLECEQLNIPYHSNTANPPTPQHISKADYLDAWQKLLEL